jgi:hypothetical protein
MFFCIYLRRSGRSCWLVIKQQLSLQITVWAPLSTPSRMSLDAHLSSRQVTHEKHMAFCLKQVLDGDVTRTRNFYFVIETSYGASRIAFNYFHPHYFYLRMYHLCGRTTFIRVLQTPFKWSSQEVCCYCVAMNIKEIVFISGLDSDNLKAVKSNYRLNSIQWPQIPSNKHLSPSTSIKKKDKVHPRTGHEGPEMEQRSSSTLSSTSALYEGGWITPRPGRFTPGKETRYPLYRKLGGPRSRCGQVRRISPQPAFFILFFFICTLSVLFFWIVLHFAFYLYCTTHTTQTSMPPAGFEPPIPTSDLP